MKKTHIVLTVFAAGLLAVPALAQTGGAPSGSTQTTPSASPPANQGAGSASGTASGSASGTAAGSASFMTQPSSGQWRASKFVGIDIYGQNNEKVGDVSEILMDRNGNAQAVVIGVGGFLGIGQKDVALPFNAVKWSDQPRPSTTVSGTGTGAGGATTGAGGTATTNTAGSAAANRTMDYPDHGMISMTRDQLKNAPEFKYASDANRASGTGTAGTGTAPARTGTAPAR